MEAAVHNDQEEFAVNKGPSHTTVHHSSGFPLSVDICSYTLLEVWRTDSIRLEQEDRQQIKQEEQHSRVYLLGGLTQSPVLHNQKEVLGTLSLLQIKVIYSLVTSKIKASESQGSSTSLWLNHSTVGEGKLLLAGIICQRAESIPAPYASLHKLLKKTINSQKSLSLWHRAIMNDHDSDAYKWMMRAPSSLSF